MIWLWLLTTCVTSTNFSDKTTPRKSIDYTSTLSTTGTMSFCGQVVAACDQFDQDNRNHTETFRLKASLVITNKKFSPRRIIRKSLGNCLPIQYLSFKFSHKKQRFVESISSCMTEWLIQSWHDALRDAPTFCNACMQLVFVWLSRKGSNEKALQNYH